MEEHIPVLLSELIAGLSIEPDKDYIDCTLGAGGHAMRVLELSSPGGKVYGLDLDKKAINIAKKNLVEYADRVVYINEDYSSIEDIVKEYSIDKKKLGGIYVDLGISSMQLKDKDKGFSFQIDAPLNMQFGDTAGVTAADILNNWSEGEIGKILKEYGEEKFWKLIANKIVLRRKTKEFVITKDLVDLILEIKPRHALDKIHPATKTFQALRIAVNDELNNLKEYLPLAVKVLPARAKLAVITFHSLEDRIVKQVFKEMSIDCICPPEFPQCVCDHKASIKKITKKPIKPSADEIKVNPRSRSAKLRIIEKI
ncbi:16S rRNA (cytosine(1402)-N(4))-methyltransferase RsmH [Patescibacteria group bacterium]|nr:16S rRNA (cytosine(1402)-N(4))-methyltransferase RsmH [Patescibacteria group bacterium]